MDIKTADRLCAYRKANGFTQEELAEKIGVSRQAVSKWDRAESSPDTDNLIALSKIYGVTLDELITGSSEPAANKPEKEKDEAPEKLSPTSEIPVNEINDNEYTEAAAETDYTEKYEADILNEEAEAIKRRKKLKHFLYAFPYPVLTVIMFMIYGFTGIGGGWRYGWLVVLTIPLYYTFIAAFFKRNPSLFCYPVLVTLVYLYLGFRFLLWHPMWILFLTIPLYYSICSGIKKLRR